MTGSQTVLSYLIFGALLGQPAGVPVERGFVKTVDGIRLYYEKAGNGPVIIAPGRLFLFDALLPLADHYTVISYDMRARGRSDAVRDSTRQTIDDDVRDLERVREFFHVERFTPIGWSYLGLMVVHYATRYPDRVASLVQIGAVPPRFDARYPPELTAGDIDSVPPPSRRAALDSLQRSGYSARHPRDYCEQEWAVTRIGLVGRAADTAMIKLEPCTMPNEWPVNVDRHIDLSVASISRLRFDRQSVKSLTFPVLTLHGTKDRNAPYGGGREWAAILPDARLLTVSGAAHAVLLERPDVVLPALRAFLGGQWPGNATRVGSSRSLRPCHYDIAVTIDPAIKLISGSLEVHAALPSDSQEILLTLSGDLTVDSVDVDGSIAPTRREGDSLFVPIVTRPDGGSACSGVVRVKYHGAPQANSLAFSEGGGHFSAATYGLPYRASGWWPSPGSTTMKADSADVRITVPNRYVAVSNGLLKSKSVGPVGWVTYHWAERYPIYPDMVSIAVAEYASFSDSVLMGDGHTMPLTFFVFPSDSDKARRDFRVFPELIRYFETVLGPYPFSREKYGVAEFARQSFREHQTVPSLGSTFITGDRKNERVLAHELAHQWFGNSLSVRNWKDVWLNEGLATYAALMWLEHDRGRAAYDTEIERLAMQRYEGTILLDDSINIARMFTSTTFEKAALMVHALRLRMGDTRFRAALRNYTEQNKYGLVTTDDFQAAMETECGESLDSFFRSWLDAEGFLPAFGVPTAAKCKLFG
jgi:pimeloyl-ACP methyl ester carboxylesterase